MPKTYYVTDENDNRVSGPFFEMGDAYRALEAEEEMSPDAEFFLEIERD